MPYKDRAVQKAANLRQVQAKRLKGRICEGCSSRPATGYHRAGPTTRALAMCDRCRTALEAIKGEN